MNELDLMMMLFVEFDPLGIGMDCRVRPTGMDAQLVCSPSGINA